MEQETKVERQGIHEGIEVLSPGGTALRIVVISESPAHSVGVDVYGPGMSFGFTVAPGARSSLRQIAAALIRAADMAVQTPETADAPACVLKAPVPRCGCEESQRYAEALVLIVGLCECDAPKAALLAAQVALAGVGL